MDCKHDQGIDDEENFDSASAIAHLVGGALLLSACQGDRLNSPSANTESQTRVFVDGEMRDVSTIGSASASNGLQVASTLGKLDKFKPLNIRSTARRALSVEQRWLDANHSVEQVVAFDARGLPANVQVRTPHGVLVVQNEFAISGNSASLVRQIVRSGQTVLIERTSVLRASLSEVPVSGLFAIGKGIDVTISACMEGLATILLPSKVYASTVDDGDPCKAQSEAAGSTHRKALLGAAAAGATCAGTGGLLCGLAIAIELDMVHDAVVAQESLNQCRAAHPEYVPPAPCTAFCHD